MTRKKITVIIILAIGAFALTHFLDFNTENDTISEETYTSDPLYTVEYTAATPVTAQLSPIGDDQPVSRGMAAKMLALALRDTAEIRSLPVIHPFNDVSPSHWYAPYINAAYTMEI